MSKSSKIKTTIIIISVIVCLPIVALLGTKIDSCIPKTVDSKEYGVYKIKLQTLGSPDWPFGSQEGRFVLKKGLKTISKTEFTLRNDGKNMNSSNWKVEWNNDKVIVTIIGEEQSDIEYICYYNDD